MIYKYKLYMSTILQSADSYQSKNKQCLVL